MGKRRERAKQIMRKRAFYLIIPLLCLLSILYWVPHYDTWTAERWVYNKDIAFKLPEVSISSTELTYRQNSVKDAYLHAFNSYEKYVWGQDELRPISHESYNWLHMGLSIVDSIDTMYIMGLTDEYNKAKDWITTHLNFNKIHEEVSAFETTIRVVGGMLSTYDLTGDELFLTKAEAIGKLIMPIFNTPSGLPYARVTLNTNKAGNGLWGRSSYLAEVGTLQMEFTTLSMLTGNTEYGEKALKVIDVLDKMHKPEGLYPVFLDVKHAEFTSKPYWLESKWNNLWTDNPGTVSLGGLGDSFYEYLLKMWILTGKTDDLFKRMYNEAMDAVILKLVMKSEPGGFVYIAKKEGKHIIHEMEHLACFAGGMFALGAYHNITEDVDLHMRLGEELTKTCHEFYVRQATGLSPDMVGFTPNSDFKPRSLNYILRPETFESYFVLYRITGNPIYQEWGWEGFQAIETYCRTSNGYIGIEDVTTKRVTANDLQQSFFMAETLKYLYLLFSPRDYISLDEWVFNTEAHPMKVWAT